MRGKMPQPGPEAYAFAAFELDAAAHRLRCNGKPVALSGKALDVLVVLVRRAGELVEKDALLSAVWPEGFVEESNLTVAVSALRKALGETPGENRFIATVPGRGYRFVGTLTSRAAEAVAPVKSTLR